MRLSLVTAPAIEPLSVAEAKGHLRIDLADDDQEVSTLIVAARQRIERITGRQLLLATWDAFYRTAPNVDVLKIPKPPLIGITAITYVDAAGVTQTWDPVNYQVAKQAGPTADFGLVSTAYATLWPLTRYDTLNGFMVRFTAGYGTAAAAVPEDLKRAMVLLMKGWYDDDAFSIERALDLVLPYKVYA